MRLEGWIILVTAILVGLPAVWIISRIVKGPPRAEPTFYCELPASAAPGFHVVVALSASLESEVPSTIQQLRAVSVALAGRPVGLVLDPGEFWLYALPVPGPIGMIQAVDTVFAAMRRDPTVLLRVAPAPIKVAPPSVG
jgi:hypothetical protein